MQDLDPPLAARPPVPPIPTRPPRPPRPPRSSSRPRIKRTSSPRPAARRPSTVTSASGLEAFEDADDGLGGRAEPASTAPPPRAPLAGRPTPREHSRTASLSRCDVDALVCVSDSAPFVAQSQAPSPRPAPTNESSALEGGRHEPAEQGVGGRGVAGGDESDLLFAEPRYRRAWQSSGPVKIALPRPVAPGQLEPLDVSYDDRSPGAASSYSPPPRRVSIYNLVEVSESPVEGAHSPPTSPPLDDDLFALASAPRTRRSPRLASSLPTTSNFSAGYVPRPPVLSSSHLATLPPSPDPIPRPPTAPASLKPPPTSRRSSGGLSSSKSARRLSALLSSSFGLGRSRTGLVHPSEGDEQPTPRAKGPTRPRPRTSDGLSSFQLPPGLANGGFPVADEPPSPQPLRTSSPSPVHRLPSPVADPALASLARSSAFGRTWRSTLAPETYQRFSLEHGSVEMRRQEVIFELCETERAFVAGLRGIVALLGAPLRGPDGAWLDMVPHSVSRLLGFLDGIVELHAGISAALDEVRAAQAPVVVRVAQAFAPFVDRLAVHQPYLVRLEGVSALIDDLVAGKLVRPSSLHEHHQQRAREQQQRVDELGHERDGELGAFTRFLRAQSRRPECGGLSLASFLLKPVQRLMKYPLFFRQLCELSPLGHPDHAAALALHASTGAMILALQEVKAREDAYAELKVLVARLRGVPEGFRLANRDRRVELEGALRLVHLSERDRAALEGTSSSSTATLGPALGLGTRRSVHAAGDHSRPISTVSVDSGSSFGSMASASSGSTTTMGSDPSTGPSTPASLLGSSSPPSWSRVLPLTPSSSDKRLSVSGPSPALAPARSAAQGAPSRLRTRARESSVQAWVMSDMLVLAQTSGGEVPKLLKSVKALERERAREGKETLRVLDGVGVSTIAAVKDWSGRTEHDFLVQVDVVPASSKSQPVSSSASTLPTSLFFTLASSTPSSSSQQAPTPAAKQEALFQSWLRALVVPLAHFSTPSSPSRPRRPPRSAVPPTASSPTSYDERALAEESAWWARRLAVVRRELDEAARLKDAAADVAARPARVQLGTGLGIESAAFRRRTSG
ncbi:hypothetical protein JCM9279_001495 [Rhodotorula babjevae]